MLKEIKPHHKRFHSRIDLLHSILSWIHHNAKEMGFDALALKEIELATEEALVNIIHHAYKESQGTIDIYLTLVPQKEIHIVIEDAGPPFDPLLEETETQTSAILEKRTLGGLGLILMKNSVDELHYERIDGKNRLTLTKKLLV